MWEIIIIEIFLEVKCFNRFVILGIVLKLRLVRGLFSRISLGVFIKVDVMFRCFVIFVE